MSDHCPGAKEEEKNVLSWNVRLMDLLLIFQSIVTFVIACECHLSANLCPTTLDRNKERVSDSGEKGTRALLGLISREK